MYLMVLIISYFPCFTVLVSLAIVNIVKRFNKLNLISWVNKVGIILNLGFLVVGVYYLQEFLYFINMDNINIIESNDVLSDFEYSSSDMVNSDLNKKMLFNTLNQKDLPNSRHSYNTNNHLLVINNGVNPKVNNDGLSILKHLEIYRSAREESALLEKSLTNHNLYLVSRINRLEKEIDHSTDLITEIIDSYLNDFGL